MSLLHKVTEQQNHTTRKAFYLKVQDVVMPVLTEEDTSKRVGKTTHSVREAMRSEWVKFNPVLNLVKFPEAVSNDRSVPTARELVPTTPEKLTVGFAVNPMLVLIPAYSC